MISNLKALCLICMSIVLCLPSPALGASSASLRGGGRHKEDTSATERKEALSSSESPPEPLTKHEKVLDHNANSSSIRTLRSTAACPKWCRKHTTPWSWCAKGEAEGKCHEFELCQDCPKCKEISSNPCSIRDRYSASCQPWCSKKFAFEKNICSFDRCSGCKDCESYDVGSRSKRQENYKCPYNVENSFHFFDTWPKGRDCSCCNLSNLHDEVDCCVNMFMR